MVERDEETSVKRRKMDLAATDYIQIKASNSEVGYTIANLYYKRSK